MTADAVVVVSGIPRSGTSLVMQMLEAGGVPVLVDDARPPDASNPRGYYEYAPVMALARDASWLERAPGRAVKVIHRLLPSLPAGRAYRVIVVRRDLGEVMASQRAMLERAGRGDAVAEPAAEARLAEVMAAQLAEAEAWVRAQPQAELLVLEHAELLREPRTAAARIARFLGCPLDVEAMAGRVDAGLHRERAAASPD